MLVPSPCTDLMRSHRGKYASGSQCVWSGPRGVINTVDAMQRWRRDANVKDRIASGRIATSCAPSMYDLIERQGPRHIRRH